MIIILAPLQRIISTENLTYIPNLYFRKYKLIQSLNHERYDFPQQKILLPRQKSSWDAVLCQMREKAELRTEIKKYKIAQNYHVSRLAKQQLIKKQLKKQERQLFHRIVANQLAEDVQQYFKNFQKNGHVNGTMKQDQGQQDQMVKKETTTRGMADDIFIDRQPEDDYIGQDNGGQIDFFDDILNDGAPIKSHLDLMNENMKQAQNQPIRRSVKDYVQELLNINAKQAFNGMDLQGELQGAHISRRNCLKRINQNLRRRLKTKAAQTEDRSLTSATVALSNLINNYPEHKQSDSFVDIPNETEWIFDDNLRNKKKKDEDFQLNWDDEQIQKFRQTNERFDLDKVKDMQTVLQLTLDRGEYPKVFERNIATNYQFPSNVQSIKSFSSKFEKKKFYFNEFPDYYYERFIMRNNKRRLLEKFEKNSDFMFAENYLQDQVQSNQKITMGKMFLYPPKKIYDRLIYKVTPGNAKISVVAKDYNKKNVPLSRQKIILLSYLVNKYLTQFGNNWKTITQFIQIFPCFSNYLIKPELVQQLYQMINRHELKINYLDNLEIWDKKILPSNQIYNGSYKDYEKVLRDKATESKHYKENQMTDESSGVHDQQNQQDVNFSLDDYEKLLIQPLQSKPHKKKIFGNLSRKYKQYGSKLYARTTNDTYNFYQNKVRKANKIIQQYRNTYAVAKVDTTQKPQNEERIVQYVQQNMKGQIKSGLPFRKKKNINQRNNQLVKILQALRSKNSVNMPPTSSQKGPQDMNKMTAGSQKLPIPPNTNIIPPTPTSQTLAGKPVQPPGQKQQKKSQASCKRVGGSSAPRKPKKKQDDKQKQ